MKRQKPPFDTFLSHAHVDAEWVNGLACRLEDECGYRVWLDRWILVPGKSWQQAVERGLNDASTCAVCIGARTPEGWFQEEIERALDLQARNSDFRVIPVLLPDAVTAHVPGFLSHRTWADFRNGQDSAFAFHVLKQGIAGQPIGRWPTVQSALSDGLRDYEERIVQLRRLHALGLHEEIVIEFERRILDEWFRKRRR